MTDTLTIPVDEVRAGDSFLSKDGNVAWTALRNAYKNYHGTYVDVVFADGGEAIRMFDHGTRIAIKRKEN